MSKKPRKPTSFYGDQFTHEEVSLIGALVQDPSLDDEIWMQRVMNRRLLRYLSDSREVPLETLIKTATALAAGTGRVARLLRDRRALSGAAADGITGAIAQALDELGSELGLDL